MGEDYGYVTLQAYLAGKPVITARDSGGVLEFVEDGVTGFVTDGSPESFGKATDRLAEDPELAQRMGEVGRARIQGWSWSGGRRHAPGAMMAADPRLGLLLGVQQPEELVMLCRELAHWVPVGDGRDGDYDVFLWRTSDPTYPSGRPHILWAEDRRAVEAHGNRALSSSPRSLPWNSSLLTRALRCDSSRASSTPDVRPGRLRLSCERAWGGPRAA